MNKPNENSTGNGGNKPSFQSQSLGPNKVASTETPPTKTPEAKPDPKPDVEPEGSPIIPEVINPTTAKPVANSPQLQKQA